MERTEMASGGRLTTHVLDVAQGRPAAGLEIELFRLDPERRRLTAVRTNADGRAETPLLAGAAVEIGCYELLFHAGTYLRAGDSALPEPLFLDLVPIRFGIADPALHYHVPLLLSPYGYTTYRGS